MINSGRRTARQEEELLVQRRNCELRKQEHWNSVAHYFKTWDVKASKYASWTSEDYYKQSEEARLEADNKDKKKQALDKRRGKMKKAFETEKMSLQDETKPKRQGASWMQQVDELIERHLEMKRRSEEARKREAELKLYQRWRQDQPTLRDLEKRQHLEFTKKCWADQAKEQEDLMHIRKAEEAMHAIRVQRWQKEAEEKEKMLLKKKEEELKELKSQIKKQMDEIKASAERCKEIEKEEAEERRLQAEIEEMIIQRKLAENRLACEKLSDCWKKQYRLKLLKKTKEMEEEILQDETMLRRLQQGLKLEKKVKSSDREFARKDMESAIMDLQIQRRKEHQRQQEYENLYCEEAKQMWEIQKNKWIQEQQARARLMAEVLETVKKQITEKIESKLVQRADTLAERVQLMEGMNRLYEECGRQEEAMKQAQANFRKDLDEQVAQKNIEKEREIQEEREFERKQNEMMREQEQNLAKEVEKIQIQNATRMFKPPDFRRRRGQW